MSVTLITNPAPGEDLLAIEPALLQQVDPGWLHRLSLFKGRTLTADALKSEQAYRAGRLALLGQLVTHGIVKGLELSTGSTAGDITLQVTPGYGISATGEDVALSRVLRTTLNSLLVVDPQKGSKIDTFANYSQNPANKTFAGVLLLQPITMQAPGSAVDSGALPVIVSGNLAASCDQDPEEFAFDDFQIVDGVRLVMVAWPATPASLVLPASSPAESWRNRLAYTVFNAELALTPDDRLPWDLLGVPLAFIGFDSGWKPQFFDRWSVVRAGGLARSHYLWPAQSNDPSSLLMVEPALAQARVSHLSEQIFDQVAASTGMNSFLPNFAFLPPSGLLPAAAMDFGSQVVKWFPPPWNVIVAPVHQEEVESILLSGMTAQPLDVAAAESVTVLVPLPDALYDPDVLIVPVVDPAFQAAVDGATLELGGVLQHRLAILQEANALSQALNGTAPGPLYSLDTGLTPTEITLRGDVLLAFAQGTHTITAVYSGDADNPKSTSEKLVQSVVADLGAVTLLSSLNPSVQGQAVTFTATVKAQGADAATGNVQFLDGTNVLATAALTNGVATFSISGLAPGPHSITAIYAGDAVNPTATSTALTQTVSPSSPALPVTVSSSANPSTSTMAVMLTATVSPTTATGSIQFMDGSTPLGPAVPLRDGVANFPYVADSDETFGTADINGAYVADDYQQLLNDAAGKYTLRQDGFGNTLKTPLPLFSDQDMQDLALNGIQHFIDRINAKLAIANDLIDLAFLTMQSDIYRLRNNVLGASDATALAVSPIVAQIATGESAAVTAKNLQDYLTSALPVNAPLATPSTTIAPSIASGSGGSTRFTASRFLTARAAPATVAGNLTYITPTRFVTALQTARDISARITTPVNKVTAAANLAGSAQRNIVAAAAGIFVPEQPGTPNQPATPTDVAGQSPVVGAQLNLRTLTIAERMKNPPSQDALFYATGNRVAFLQLLADLEITIDDIPILADVPQPVTTSNTTTTPPPSTTPQGPRQFTIGDIRSKDATRINAVFNAVSSPLLHLDSDEAYLFSTSVTVLELHSQVLRAVEARIAEYKDFVSECATAVINIQADLPQAETLIGKLENDLAQARQDLQFTTALLNDETARVAALKKQRADTLQNVQTVVYTRPRTVQPDADVPSRQLVPGNIANPAPTCSQQTAGIPPELNEIVSFFREAPIAWLPTIQQQLNKLVRITVLQDLAAEAQARAAMQVSLPLLNSWAASLPSVYGNVIASVYDYNQQAFRTAQAERASYDLSQLANQSWTAQIQILQNFVAAGDLLSSRAVQLDVGNLTSRLLQQISGVATCVYTRACEALPIDRLEWAEFLRGTGLSIQLRSLAVLPNWNGLDYVSRQQMQMLVDWLFLQIDTSIPQAVAFMSDIVRVAFLLAAGAPLNQVISGAVTLTTTPVLGGVVSLTLPSERIAKGMFVQLYSAGALAAEAVVSDLDNVGVRATVTRVYQANTQLQANDVAHFSAQAPQAVALRAFDR
jgi:hypothetical protein